MGTYFESEVNTDEKISKAKERIEKRLKRVRKKNGDCQKDVAETTGYSKGQISLIERGKGDIKAAMIPILADKYGTYAETFFTENGSVSCDMLARLLNSASLSCDNDAAREYLEEMVDRVITQGRSEELLLMFYTSIRTCYNYKEPLEHISEEMSKIDKVHSSKELEMYVKNWEIEH